jgi:signal recognition particle subunit SRP68
MELKADYHQALTSSNQKTNLTLSLQRNNASKGKIGSSPGAIRQQYLARLKKATKYANEFEGIAAHVCDEATSLEIKAYTNWILGTWFCETGDWQNACSRLSNSLHICQKLSEITSSSTIEALQLSDFFSSRAKNVIQPLLRYCQYELQQIDGNIQQDPTLLNTDAAVENEYILTKLEAIRQNSLEAEAQKSGSDNSFVISFRGKDLLVDNQFLRVQLLQMDEYKKDLIKSPQSGGKGGDAKFLKHLSCIDDAISIISQELKEYAGLESGPAVNKKRFEFDCLLGYCKYEKLKLMMERNEKMVNELKVTDREHILGSSTSKRSSKKESTTDHTDPDSQYKKVEEIAHLYDALMQDARDVVTLPGLGSFDDSLNTNDDIIEDDFMLEANANLLRIRALRCYYMGRMYASDAVGKYQEAVALYDVASRLASEAAEEIAACPNMERADELIESMVDLESDIVGAKCRADACAYLAKRGSGASSATNGATLLNRIDDFDSGGKTYRLSNVPLTLELVACKPSFFDIANNYVSDFPMEELRGHINAHNTQSRGFLKWFRR